MLEGASTSAVADQLFSTGITPVHINEAKAAAALAVGKLGGRFGEPKVDLADLMRSEEHTSELQSRLHLVCRLLLEKKKKNNGTQAPSLRRHVHIMKRQSRRNVPP